jgi:chromate transporter
MEWLWLFLIFLRASFLSVNGQTALPILRQDLVATGITTDQRVIEALTIGRLGTGPGGLYIVALGYFIMGWIGALAALVATLLPPLLVLPVSSWLRPRLAQPRVNGAMRGLALATSGLVIVTSLFLLLAIGDGGLPAPWQLALVGVAYVLSLDGRLHPLWMIVGGAAVGILAATVAG